MTTTEGGRGVPARRLLSLGLLLLLGFSPARGQIGLGELEPRHPVILVPGWSDDAQELEPLRERFLEAGWEAAQVLALEFEDPVGSNRAHAREVGAAVDSLLAATGAARVDVVAHSMGGLAVRWYLHDAGGARVRRVVFLGTPHRGTLAAYLAWGEGGEEMVPGSDFLGLLNQEGALPEGVRAITIRTPVDLRVIPTKSATLHDTGVTNVEICCPTHEGLLDHQETFVRIRNFLRQPPPELEGAGKEGGERPGGWG